MARSGGVTFSAVVVLIGSSLTILFGALMALAILWTPNAGQAANLPIPIGYVVTAEAIVFFGFGGWGIASGVGLIKLRQWSRVSMMIYGAILLFFSAIPGIVLSFVAVACYRPQRTSEFHDHISGDYGGFLRAAGGSRRFLALFLQ